MAWAGRNVLVTGAGGFIGSHLVELLVEQGAQVRALLHYNSRSDVGNLQFLPAEALANVELLFGDIQDAGCVDAAVAGCDCVLHLAALIGIPYSYVAPRSYVSTNIGGTLNVLEACRRHQTPRLVQTSTSECYGTARYEPIDEAHPLQGQSPYSASKIGADKLAESYYLSFELPVATIRPFNTYGPRQSARAVIPTIISQLLAGQSEIQLGSLDPMRDLTFVKDTARGFLAIAEADALLGEVTNIGNGKAIRIGDLAEKLVAMINPDAKIVCRDSRVRPEGSEVMKLICGHEKAKTLAHWQPRVSLEQGLQETIDFMRDHQHLFDPNTYTL